MMIFCDSFSHYTDPFLDVMWDAVVDPEALVAQSTTSGRFGAGGVTFSNRTPSSTSSGAYIQKNYDGVATIICGLAVKQTTTQRTIDGGRLLTFLDGNTTQVALTIMESGQIEATRSESASLGIYLARPGSSGTGVNDLVVLGVSANAVSSTAYDFLEFKIVHHPTTGSIEVKRNGAAFWTLSNVNTAVSGTNISASVLVGGYTYVVSGLYQRANWLQAIVSDFHLLNTTVDGSDALNPVDFIGDRHWEVLVPAADGFYTDWTPNPVNDHYLNVDEIPPDDGTTENNTETVGNIDSFETDTPTGPSTASTIMAYTMYLEKNAGGSVGVSGLFRLAGADRNGTEFQVPNPYAFRQSFLASKPGGGAITVADVGNGEHGYERTS